MAVTRTIQQNLAAQIMAGDTGNLVCPVCGIYEHSRKPKSRTWCHYYEKFKAYLDGGNPGFSVFIEGNAKLPFWSFSSLPGITCPGAGDCLNWCYSFKAWRYPAAYFRQVQNAHMMKYAPAAIAAAWAKLPGGTVRLYVDGDFDSMTTLKFWFDLMEKRPDLNVYGYSKSWALFIAYADKGGVFPTNYTLNLSGGSKYNAAFKARMYSLPVTRGDFDAVDMSDQYSKAPDRRKAPALFAKYAAAVKAAARAQGTQGKMFVCPGKCGDCLPNGEHACGSDRFRNVKVLIGLH